MNSTIIQPKAAERVLCLLKRRPAARAPEDLGKGTETHARNNTDHTVGPIKRFIRSWAKLLRLPRQEDRRTNYG